MGPRSFPPPPPLPMSLALTPHLFHKVTPEPFYLRCRSKTPLATQRYRGCPGAVWQPPGVGGGGAGSADAVRPGWGEAPLLYLPDPANGAPSPPGGGRRALQPHIPLERLRPRPAPLSDPPQTWELRRHSRPPPAPGRAGPSPLSERAPRPNRLLQGSIPTLTAPGSSHRARRPLPWRERGGGGVRARCWRDLAAAAAVGAQLRRRLYMAGEEGNGRGAGEGPASRCLPTTGLPAANAWTKHAAPGLPNGAKRGRRGKKKKKETDPNLLHGVRRREEEPKRGEGTERRPFGSCRQRRGRPRERHNGRGRLARANGCGAPSPHPTPHLPGVPEGPPRPRPGPGAAGGRETPDRGDPRPGKGVGCSPVPALPVESTRDGEGWRCGLVVSANKPGKQPARGHGCHRVCFKNGNSEAGHKTPTLVFFFLVGFHGEKAQGRGVLVAPKGVPEARGWARLLLFVVASCM